MVLKITVKTLDSQNYQFEAEDDWTVGRFKEHIQDTVQAPHNEQRLIFCGRVLQDDKKLVEYDCDGKVMHLVRRPPPSLDNQDHDSAANTSDSNNNDSSFPGELRLGENDNVLFSAMTLGSIDGPNQMLRHIMALQQELYSRIIGEPTGFFPAYVENGDPEIGRRLHNATRLSRMIDGLINECTSRLVRVTRQSRSRNSTSMSASTSQSDLDLPPPVLGAALSHNDLQAEECMQTSEIEPQAPVAQSSFDDSAAMHRASAAPSTTSRRLSRPALTTDDLPQANSRSARPFEPAVESRPRNENSSAARQESQLDQYLTLLTGMNDIIDRTRNLVSRYRELIMISRNGGFIMPNQAAAGSQQQTNSAETIISPEGSNQSPISAALLNEARIYRQYVPRILHHGSHLQHALSDFSVDFSRGRLQVVSHLQGSQAQPIGSAHGRLSFGLQDSASESSRDHSHIEIPLDVTITATTVETQPISTASSSQSQASATIVVTSEPVQTGVHIPIPLVINTRNTVPMRASPIQNTGQVRENNDQRDSPRSPSPNVSDQQQRTNRENTSTQTAPRRFRIISERAPLPFDYYLTCFSPFAQYTMPTERVRSEQMSRIHRMSDQSRYSRPRGATPTRPANPNVHVQSNTIPLNTQPLDAGLTEVVNNIIGSIFRQPPSQQQSQSTGQAQGASAGTSASSQTQDSLLNMIPELAINAAMGLFGHASGVSEALQSQDSTQQRTAQQSVSGGHTMMDIDIDDSSSSHSESRFQDSRASRTQAGLPEQSTRQPQTTSQPPVSHSPRYNRDHVLEALQNRLDWIPIIEADIDFMQEQGRLGANSHHYFSDAYLSSVPRKRQRLLTATPDRVFILHPSPSQAIKNLLRRAVANSNLSVEVQDHVLESISNDQELQNAYEEYIKSAVEARLRSDYDYTPEKFENSSKYFR